MYFIIECVLCLLAVAIALTRPTLGSNVFQAVEQKLAWIARSHKLSILTPGLLAICLRLLVLPILPIPEPAAHDEFSYLLMADTFAHGRLANPIHPMWVHFESFHIIQRPTYVSMYYPAQGVFLAIGQVLFGHPFWGAVLSIGVMCSSICWMLQGWLPSFWAVLGGLIVAIRVGTFSYWANSYWGGAAAAIGGALVLGSLPRIKRRMQVCDALLLGLGIAILFNSRPFESIFFCLPVAIALIVWTLRLNAGGRGLWFRHILVPLGLLLVTTIIGMLYYFWRTTGNALLTAYQVNLHTYNSIPYFPWQPLKPFPEYHHAVMQNFYEGWWLQQYEFGRLHPIFLLLIKFNEFWFFFLGPVLTLCLFVLATILPYGLSINDVRPRLRFLLIVLCISAAGMLLPVYFNPHYGAALTSVVYALVLLAMQHVRRWKRGDRATGVAIVRAVPAICVAMFVLRAIAPVLHLPISNWVAPQTWCSPTLKLPGRDSVLAKLESQPGRHLVIVHYGLEHDPRGEWVYNRADIDSSKVVFARDMGESKNDEIVRYFSGRHIWLVDADAFPARLVPYAGRKSIAEDDTKISDSSSQSIQGPEILMVTRPLSHSGGN